MTGENYFLIKSSNLVILIKPFDFLAYNDLTYLALQAFDYEHTLSRLSKYGQGYSRNSLLEIN